MFNDSGLRNTKEEDAYNLFSSNYLPDDMLLKLKKVNCDD